MKTLLITTTSPHMPPNIYNAHKVNIFARPSLKNGAGLGMNASNQCSITAMAINIARIAIRELVCIYVPQSRLKSKDKRLRDLMDKLI